MSKLLCIWGIFFIHIGYAQEICDNAIDDDNDGLIDLNDPDCQCGPGFETVYLPNAIPNPNFDLQTCCPDNLSTNSQCLNDWESSNPLWNFDANFAANCNSCDFLGLPQFGFYPVLPPECFQNTTPNGFLMMSYAETDDIVYNDFMSVCLNTALQPGYNYRVECYIYRPYQTGPFAYNNSYTELALAGSNSCAYVPMLNSTCSTNPYFFALDSLKTTIPIDTAWHQYSFNFTPSSAVTAIGLGPNCHAGSQVAGTNFENSVWIDSLKLFCSPPPPPMQINQFGSFCRDSFNLVAKIDTIGGTWQWYKDSIAIIGETNDTIDIKNYGIGNYTALYTLSGNCKGINVLIEDEIYPVAYIFADNACQLEAAYLDGEGVVPFGSGLNIANYYWDYGNGDTGFSEDTNYYYPNPGTFLLSLIVETNRGCQDTITQQIVISPQANISFNSNGQCISNNFNFTSLSSIPSGEIDLLTWNFGDNTFSSDSATSHTYSNTGPKTVSLIAMTDKGCMDTLKKNIFVNPTPTINFAFNDTCQMANITAVNQSTLSSGTIGNYLWDFGDNSSSTSVNPTHAYANPGTYQVKLIAITDSTCTDSLTQSITIHPNPISSFTMDSSCYLLTFNNLSTISTGSITNTLWSFGDNNSSQSLHTSHLYQADGTYALNLLSTSDQGCTDDSSFQITLKPRIEASIKSNELVICNDECAVFTSPTILPEAGSYQWNFSNGVSSSVQAPQVCFNSLDTNEYLIDASLKIVTMNGCIDSIFIPNILRVVPRPTANFSFSPASPKQLSPIVTFVNLSKNANDYLWNFGDNSQSTQTSMIHHYPEIPGTYAITLTAFDQMHYCPNELTKTIIIEEEIIYYVPNAFTPNKNGRNEIFQPIFFSGYDIYNFKFQVFNRWGEIIFESNDASIGWDGTYQNKLVAPGTYVWKIDFKEGIKDKVHIEQGTVNVIR